jgi:hypothetical protein
MNDWLSIALRRDVLGRGIRVGAIVGTILVLINQGDVILDEGVAVVFNWKTLLTFLVPYCVSTYAGVSAILSADSGASDN